MHFCLLSFFNNYFFNSATIRVRTMLIKSSYKFPSPNEVFQAMEQFHPSRLSAGMPTCCGVGCYWLIERDRCKLEGDEGSSTDMNGCGPQSQILSLTRIRHGGVHVTFTFVAHAVTPAWKIESEPTNKTQQTWSSWSPSPQLHTVQLR